MQLISSLGKYTRFNIAKNEKKKIKNIYIYQDCSTQVSVSSLRLEICNLGFSHLPGDGL
jgi:hypothetical protein